jgi:protein-S-isoprenylcysteine O-methyltransferase Ste14
VRSPRAVVGVVYVVVIYGALLFLPAWTLAWPRAWLFLGLVAVAAAGSIIGVTRANPDLIGERMKAPIQKGQPVSDRVVLLLFVATYFGQTACVPLDVFRFHLLGGPGPAGATLGFILFFAGWWLVYRAQRENAFASAVVRHQAERGQTVVDTGPYAVVRHPMYAGAIPLVLGLPLALGSYAGAALALVPLVVALPRIFIEERLLRRELPGYEAYLARVRWRLVPYVW